MSPLQSRLSGRAAALRIAFDGTFQSPHPTDEAGHADYLIFRVEQTSYALSPRELRGLFADRKIVSVPTAALSFLGLTGSRGAILPVHDLHQLVGHAPAEAPRWMVLAKEEAVALAFDHFERFVRARPDEVAATGDSLAAKTLFPGILHQDGGRIPILRLAELLSNLRGAPIPGLSAPIEPGRVTHV